MIIPTRKQFMHRLYKIPPIFSVHNQLITVCVHIVQRKRLLHGVLPRGHTFIGIIFRLTFVNCFDGYAADLGANALVGHLLLLMVQVTTAVGIVL